MNQRLHQRVRQTVGVLALLGCFALHLAASEPVEVDLERGFTNTVRPFVETYCITCRVSGTLIHGWPKFEVTGLLAG